MRLPIRKLLVESYLPTFIKELIIPLLVVLAGAVILASRLKLDWQQKTSLIIADLAFGFFLAYTLHKNGQPSKPVPDIHQESHGSNSPNVIGDDNSIK